eukprot:3524161-Rhodomonas_salina.1
MDAVTVVSVAMLRERAEPREDDGEEDDGVERADEEDGEEDEEEGAEDARGGAEKREERDHLVRDVVDREPDREHEVDHRDGLDPNVEHQRHGPDNTRQDHRDDQHRERGEQRVRNHQERHDKAAERGIREVERRLLDNDRGALPEPELLVGDDGRCKVGAARVLPRVKHPAGIAHARDPIAVSGSGLECDHAHLHARGADDPARVRGALFQQDVSSKAVSASLQPRVEQGVEVSALCLFVRTVGR